MEEKIVCDEPSSELPLDGGGAPNPYPTGLPMLPPGEVLPNPANILEDAGFGGVVVVDPKLKPPPPPPNGLVFVLLELLDAGAPKRPVLDPLVNGDDFNLSPVA